MSTRLKLQKFQIVLLELYATTKDFETVHVPAHVRRSLAGMGPSPYIERTRRQQKCERNRLYQRIDYLKRQHYIARVKEGEEILYRLTAKAKYEILRLQFTLHMRAQKAKAWNKHFYLIVFDVPEEKKNHRDFFRKLLKRNGFKMLQLSVWMTRYNPRPAIDELLKYLGLEKYFELMKISCGECSVKLQRKIR